MYWLNFNEMIIDIPPEPCPAGQYRSADMLACEQCGGNEISAEGASTCTACGGGKVATVDRTECGTWDIIVVQLTINREHDIQTLLQQLNNGNINLHFSQLNVRRDSIAQLKRQYVKRVIKTISVLMVLVPVQRVMVEQWLMGTKQNVVCLMK